MLFRHPRAVAGGVVTGQGAQAATSRHDSYWHGPPTARRQRRSIPVQDWLRLGAAAPKPSSSLSTAPIAADASGPSRFLLFRRLDRLTLSGGFES